MQWKNSGGYVMTACMLLCTLQLIEGIGTLSDMLCNVHTYINGQGKYISLYCT